MKKTPGRYRERWSTVSRSSTLYGFRWLNFSQKRSAFHVTCGGRCQWRSSIIHLYKGRSQPMGNIHLKTLTHAHKSHIYPADTQLISSWLTSPVPVAQIREAPNVSQADDFPGHGEDELHLICPFLPRLDPFLGNPFIWSRVTDTWVIWSLSHDPSICCKTRKRRKSASDGWYCRGKADYLDTHSSKQLFAEAPAGCLLLFDFK